MESLKEEYVYFYKCKLTRDTAGNEYASVHGFVFEKDPSQPTRHVEWWIGPTSVCGYFYIRANARAANSSSPVPIPDYHNLHFERLSPDKIAGKVPQALLEMYDSGPPGPPGRIWFRVSGILPTGKNFPTPDAIKDHVCKNVKIPDSENDGEIHYCPFAMPHHRDFPMDANEVLLRMNHSFAVPGVYSITGKSRPAIESAKGGAFPIISAVRFAEIFPQPVISADLHPALSYGRILIQGNRVSSVLVKMASWVTEQAHILENGMDDILGALVTLKSIYQTSRDNDSTNSGGLSAIIICPDTKNASEDDLSQFASQLPDDGGSKTLQFLCRDWAPDSNIFKCPREWLIMCSLTRPGNVDDADSVASSLRIAQIIASRTQSSITRCFHHLKVKPRSVKLTGSLLTKVLLAADYSVLPWSSSKHHTSQSDQSEMYSPSVTFKGGDITSQPGLYFEDETHSIVHVDATSYYPTILVEQALCLTRSLSLMRPPLNIEALTGRSPEPFKITVGAQPVQKPTIIQDLAMPPVAREFLQLIAARKKARSPEESSALKNVANSAYGALASPYMRYFCPAISLAVAAWGRKYLRQFREAFGAALCPPEETGCGVILSVTDSIILRTRKVSLQQVESICKAVCNSMSLKRVTFSQPVLYESMWVKNSGCYAWLPKTDTNATVTRENVRGTRIRNKTCDPETLQLLLQFLTVCIQRTTVQTDLVLLIAQISDPELMQYIRGNMLELAVTRFPVLATDQEYLSIIKKWDTAISDYLATKLRVKRAKITDVESSTDVFSKDGRQQQQQQNRKLWFEPGVLDTRIGFV